MARPAPFRQADLTRALKGALNAGVKPSRAEIDADGKLVIVFDDESAEVMPLDKWRAGRGSRAP
jgi:hypothetical protein